MWKPPCWGGALEAAERHFYWEFHERGFQQAMLWKKWKAIRAGRGKAIRLYDLDQDPGEKKDLAAAHGVLVERFAALMESSRTESRQWPVQAK